MFPTQVEVLSRRSRLRPSLSGIVLSLSSELAVGSSFGSLLHVSVSWMLVEPFSKEIRQNDAMQREDETQGQSFPHAY